MQKIYIGIDNGVTGAIGIIFDKTEKYSLIPVPTKKEQSYTKKKQNITRICFDKLFAILNDLKHQGNCFICLENPMKNPGRFKASESAIRCLEAEYIAIEQLLIPREFITSKDWQKIYLPKGSKGRAEQKKMSLDIGLRLFPEMTEQIIKQGDADALFIAKYLREKSKGII
jgi:hypothetical protein